MPDPVAWTMVEPGWKVLRSGAEIGRVAEVLGDPEADIFDGLNVTKGLLSSTDYVPSEHVEQIREGEVHLVSGSVSGSAEGEVSGSAEGGA